MPNIQPYKQPELGLTPSDRGAAAFAAAGRRGGAFYNQAGQSIATAGQRFGRSLAEAGDAAVAYQDHEQIREGAARGTELFNNLQESKDQAIKAIDPNDPSYGSKVDQAIKKWREDQLEPQLDQFQQGFSTEKSQQWADHFISATRQHMFVSSTADISTASGIGVKNAIKRTVDVASNIVLNDPSALRTQLDLFDHSLKGLVGSSPLKGTDSARLLTEVGDNGRKALVHAAMFGAIQKADDPEAVVKKFAAEFPQEVNAVEELKAAKAAKTQARVNSNVEKQGVLLKKQLAEQAVHQGANKAFNDNVSIDQTTGRPTINPKFFKDILDVAHQNGDAPNAATVAKTYLDWGESQMRAHNEVITTDPKVYGSLIDRMGDPTKPTTDVDILREAAAHHINAHDTQIALSLNKALTENPIKAPGFRNSLAGVKAELGNGDLGTSNYHKFFEDFVPMVQQLEREGKLPPNALSLQDKNSLLNKTLDQYRLTPQQKMIDHISKNLGIGVNPSDINLSPGAVPSAAPAVERKIGNVVVPPALRGIAALQHNSKTGQWRDQTSGIVYDSAGNEIKK